MTLKGKTRVLPAVAVLLVYVGLGLFSWGLIHPSGLVQYPLMILLWPIIFDIFGGFIILAFLIILILVACTPEIRKSRFFLALAISVCITSLSILMPFYADLPSIKGPPRGDPGPGFRGDIFSYGKPFPFVFQQSRLEKEAIARLNPIRIAGARETPTQFAYSNLAASFAFWFFATLITIEVIVRGMARRVKRKVAT